MYELDNQMLKKLLKLCDQCLQINSMQKPTKASFQINHDRIIISVQDYEVWGSFPSYTFQSHFVNLTYANLDAAIAAMNHEIMYIK